MWEKEEMMLTIIFSFSLHVFERAFRPGLFEVGIVW